MTPLNYVILLFLGSWSILFLAFGSWRVLILDPAAGKAIDQKCFCSWDFLCYRLMRKMSIPILFSLHWFLLMDGNPPFTFWVWDWYWWFWPLIWVFSQTHHATEQNVCCVTITGKSPLYMQAYEILSVLHLGGFSCLPPLHFHFPSLHVTMFPSHWEM